MTARAFIPALALVQAAAAAGTRTESGGAVRADAGISAAAVESFTPPEALSPWAAVDDEIERLVARGELPFEAWSFRPIDRGELAAWLMRAEPGEGPSHEYLARELQWERDRWWGDRGTTAPASARRRPGALISHSVGDRLLCVFPYLRCMPRLRTDREPAWTDSSRIGVRVLFQAGRSFSIATGFFAAEIPRGRSFADPLVAGSDFILHADEVTLSARLGPLRLRAGRDRHRWGPGVSGTLLLSDRAEPFDFAEQQIRLGEHLRFVALTGITNRLAAAAGANPGRQRYVSAHRLLWTPAQRLSLGFTEGARYQSGNLPLLYALGILPYTLVERLAMQDEPSDSTEDYLRNNVLWSFDVTWRCLAECVVYAEVLADDIAMKSAAMPTRGGFQLGVTYAPRWRGWDWTLGAEFTRVSNYTYSVYYQNLCQCNWEHQGEPLGFWGGPDVQELLLRCGVCPAPRWSAKAWLRLARKGAGAIGMPWAPGDEACAGSCGWVGANADAWELSDPVVNRRAGGVELRFRPHVLFWSGVAVERVRSEQAQSGARARSDTSLRLYVSAGS